MGGNSGFDIGMILLTGHKVGLYLLNDVIMPVDCSLCRADFGSARTLRVHSNQVTSSAECNIGMEGFFKEKSCIRENQCMEL